MALLSLTFTDSGFDPAFTGNLQAMVDSFVANLAATSPSDFNLMSGKIGGSAPLTSSGPWLNGRTWYAWNGASYSPEVIKLGSTANQITLTATPTTARTITFQDQSGTVALLSDITAVPAAVSLSGTTPVIDFSAGQAFYITLSGNTTITTSHSQAGQAISIRVVNPAAYTVSWGSSIAWPGGTAPVQTTSGTDLYKIENLAGNLFGDREGADFS